MFNDAAAKVHAPVFDLCSAREKRFLLDLTEQKDPEAVDDHPIPELHALLRAIEHMWGGADAKQLTAPPALIYWLAAYATYAHLILEDVEGYRSSAAHDVRQILRGFMEAVAVAIKNGSVVQHEDGGAYIDLFRIPQSLYNEMVKDRPVSLEYE